MEEVNEAAKSVAIVPVREKEVDFYGDAILVAQGDDEMIWVPLRPLCDHLGLNWSGARQRVNRDPVLSEAQGVCIIHTPGGDQRMLCLPLDLIPGWLFGVTVSKVRPELQEKILRYQRECFRVLWNAFKTEIMPADPRPSNLSGAAMALEIAEAVAALARQQLEMEQRYITMADYMRGFVQQVKTTLGDHDQRLASLELRLDPKSVITEEQAAELALAVKNVGQRLATKGDRNGYAKVYSELYRRYGVSSYRNLSQGKYKEALAWLRGWYGELEENVGRKA
jgi:P22_AR N-terminal domain